MSLLIKALDKAQAEKAQVKKTKDEPVNQVHDERSEFLNEQDSLISESKIPIVNLTIADANSELSLSPPKAPLLEEANFDANRIPASVLDSAAVAAQREASVKAIEKPSEILINQPIALAANRVNNQSGTQPNKQKTNPTPTQAAKVFAAKRIDATHQNTKLAVIVGAGLIAMLAMGAYYYQFLDDSSEVVVPQRPIATQQTVTPPQMSQTQEMVETKQPVQKTPEPDATQVFEPRETAQLGQKHKNEANAASQGNDEGIADNESVLEENEVMVSTNKKSSKSNSMNLNNTIASESASIEVTQNQQQPSVSPVLMRAYEAYTAGNDSEAQKLYKQVLQRDILNVDALLGLGAIAARQGRIADANGWYRKVLETEPRNSIAQAALLDIQHQANPQANESNIKSLIAKAPNDANLYVALGNLYAGQNQWPAAQQAYFEAYSLNNSAENAYNLGVCLDQMGKPKLALPYYQQALQSAQLEASGIDRAALEARIASIQ